MRNAYYFQISQNQIQILKSSGLNKKSLFDVDVININNCSDDQITTQLKVWIKQKRIRLRNTPCGLVISRGDVILKHLVLPTRVDDEIKSMVELQILKLIPYDRSEVEIDFQVLEKMDNGYTKVVVVVVERAIVNRYWKIFSNAGIEHQFITISSVGLWLLYQAKEGLDNALASVIDFEDDRMEICVCTKDHWLNSRVVSLGLEKMLREGCEEFFKQWHVTVDDKSQNKSTRMGSIVFVQSAQIPAVLNEALSKGLSCEMKNIDIAKFVKVVNGVGSKSWGALVGVANAVGNRPINLVPHDVRLAVFQRGLKKEMLVMLVASIGALFIGIFALNINAFNSQARLSELDKMIKVKRVGALRVQEELKQIEGLHKRFENRFRFSKWVEAIYNVLPDSISLVNISLNDGHTISIQGISSVSRDVNLLQNKMVSMPTFSNVSLDFVNKRITQEGEVNYFKITSVFNSSEDYQ